MIKGSIQTKARTLLIAIITTLLIFPTSIVYADNTVDVDNTGDQTAASGPAADTQNTTNPITGDTVTTEPTATDVPDTPIDTSAQTDASPDPDLTVSPDPALPAGTDPVQANTDTTVDNTLNSDAQSGDATVAENGTAGNAATGNAAAQATIINAVSSDTGLSGPRLVTFSQDINGNVTGDIYLDPLQGNYGTPANTQPCCAVPTTVNTNAQINNEINLNAASGHALVQGNDSAGNATSGNANAQLNLINIINSLISSGQSFIGTLNISGNLDGDILLPDAMMHNLSAGGIAAPAVSGNLDNTSNGSIENNISLAAISGQASIDHNGSAGNATTGSATTRIRQLNLANLQLIGSNSVLVFVNVMGKWVGMIVDMPDGATSAALGDASSADCTSDCPVTNLTSTTNAKITNNINLAATSGDATVAHNGKAGDATTGDAYAGLDLINIINSQLTFSDWFGILFINVFGSWNGSFGMDTAAGEPIVLASHTTKHPKKPKQRTVQVAVFNNYLFPTQLSEVPDHQTQTNITSTTIDSGPVTPSTNSSNLPKLFALIVLGTVCLTALYERRRKLQRLIQVTETQVISPTI